MNNIYITGFMSSGKTVVSREFSRITGKKVVDTDALIEQKLKSSIMDIFESRGEEYFRKEETAVLEEVSKNDNLIISTGGGIILSSENRKIMHETGLIVCIMPEFSVIESRLNNARKTRPLLNDETVAIRKRFDDRMPFYKDCDIEINPDLNDTPKDIARKIIERL